MVQISKNVKKSSKRIDEVSDPLYFLKDQISHYINICIYFSKKVFLQKKHCLLPVCQLPIYIHTHTHICIYIYIYTQTHTHMHTQKGKTHHNDQQNCFVYLRCVMWINILNNPIIKLNYCRTAVGNGPSESTRFDVSQQIIQLVRNQIELVVLGNNSVWSSGKELDKNRTCYIISCTSRNARNISTVSVRGYPIFSLSENCKMLCHSINWTEFYK